MSAESTSQETSQESGAPAVQPPSQPPLAQESPAEPAEAAETRPKRKVQLNPIARPEEARPVPTVTEHSPPPPPARPVEVPEAGDEDVEAAVQAAVSSLAGESPSEAGQPGAPVEVPPEEKGEPTVEAAIEAALSGGAAAPAVASEEQLQPGSKISGTVVSVGEENVFLDFGLRSSGVLPSRQFGSGKVPAVGQRLDVVVERVDEDEGLIITNLPRGVSRVHGDWHALAPGQVIECQVQKTNKGGLEVSVGSLRGFMPASQVDLGFIADLSPLVGQKLKAKVIEVKPERRRLVVSRRQVLAEERQAAEKELLEDLKVNDVRSGRVKTIKDYGAFVDLGGIDGFLPIGQMSWLRIGHPSEILQPGQEVEVKVLSIDPEKKKISLSMRQLAPNPWKSAEEKYPKGSTVTGRVTRVETFGAFVELEPGVEGLVHISELDHKRVKRVTEVLNVGDMADVQVVEVDPGRKRVSLSVKALKAKPEPEAGPADEDLAPGRGEQFDRKRKGPLKGGIGGTGKGGLFGNPSDFRR